MGNPGRRPNPIHDPLYRQLCGDLKQLRLDAGLTQAELGAAFDRPHTFIHKVEGGDRRIDPVEFCRWCLACNADPGEILGAFSANLGRKRSRR